MRRQGARGPVDHRPAAVQGKNRLVAEYALRGVAKPMGVAEYQLMREVPPSLEIGLPTIDQIEAELRPDLPDGAP